MPKPAEVRVLLFSASLRTDSLNLVEAAKHYPCIKKAWVEFLGEPGATVGRVEAA